jgi:hypothetical protein
LTRQKGIIAVAIAVAIVLVCLLLFLPGKAETDNDNKEKSQAPGAATEMQTPVDEDLAAEEDATSAGEIKPSDDTQADISPQNSAKKPASETPSKSKESGMPAKSTDAKESTKPVTPEPEKKEPSISITIDCTTILSNMDLLTENSPNKVALVPGSGIILEKTFKITDGEPLLDVLKRATKASKVKFVTGIGGYISEVGNFAEFDCGALSGWLYSVNGVYADRSASKYEIKDGDKVVLRYTCDLGKDIGADGVTQG